MFIVQVCHAHPPFAAAVFNCYQMYSKASFPQVKVPPCTCKGLGQSLYMSPCFKGPLQVCTEVLPKIELYENEIIHVMHNW